MAQATAPGSDAVDPGQLEKRFQPPLRPRATPPTVPESKAQLPPEEATRIRFRLAAVRLEGVTVFAPDHFAPLYADLLEREISLQDLYQLAARITADYGNAGYLLARAIVPPQTIDHGEVRLTVVEGYVDEVIVEGATGTRSELLDHYVARIKASRPLHASVLERYLLLANGLPGLRLQSVLRPSPDNTGAATLILSASRTPWRASLSLDNRGSRAIGPWQILAEGSANDVLGRFERTSLRFATVPGAPEELRYYQLSHAQILDGEGTTLELELTGSHSEPGGDALRLLEVTTRSHSLKATIAYPLLRSRSRNLALGAGFTRRDSETLQLGQLTANDRLAVLHLGAVYDQADAWGGVNLFAVNLRQGLEILDAKVSSRVDARPDFTKLEFEASRTQTLGERWSATLRCAGQLANRTLPVPEQFGLGGEGRGRGYDPSEWTGDRALAADLELAWTPPLPDVVTGQIFAFYDHGTLWRRQPVNQPPRQAAASAGFGARLALPGNANLTLEAARPLDRRADGGEPDWRLFLRAALRF